MIKTVIFDMDGTMVDSKQINLESLNKVLVYLGKNESTIDEYNIAYSMTSGDTFKYYGICKKNIDLAIEMWTNELEPMRGKSELFPGILNLIRELNVRGYNLGIITSRFYFEAIVDIERFDLFQYFDEIITVSDVENAKPHTDSLDEYIKRTGANADEILYLGDSEHDSTFSKNADIFFGLALWGTSDKNIEATVKFEDPFELLDYLETSN